MYLKPKASYTAVAVVTDPDHDKLTYRWELLPEPTKVGEGGDFEERPKSNEGVLLNNTGNGTITLKTPDKEGAYRLFVYATDGKNNVATANIPFYVRN